MTPLKRRRRSGIWLLLAALGVAGAAPWPTQAAVSKEYQVKAVFLFNLTQFVTWPPNAWVGAKEPFCIGVLGEDPFGTFLDETIRGEKVGGHPLVVRRYKTVQDVKDCQILFISRSESKNLLKVLTDLKGRNILTVGDVEGFAKSGGIVRFLTEKNKVRFMINREAAKIARLTLSSKLLRLAEIVRTERD